MADGFAKVEVPLDLLRELLGLGEHVRIHMVEQGIDAQAAQVVNVLVQSPTIPYPPRGSSALTVIAREQLYADHVRAHPRDYTAVPSDVWNRLVDQHGVPPDSEVLNTFEDGEFEGRQLRPIQLEPHESTEPSYNDVSMEMARRATHMLGDIPVVARSTHGERDTQGEQVTSDVDVADENDPHQIPF